MADIQSFQQLYKELCEQVVEHMPQIVHQDLWQEQMSFLGEEHPFEAPAIFYEFRGVDSADMSQLVQQVDMQIDVYLFYETFLDTNHGSYNQTEALDYLEDLTTINKIFHGFKGEFVDNMRRVTFGRVNTGTAGNLYRVTFAATTRDHSAVRAADGIITNELELSKESVEDDQQESGFIF